MDFGAGIRRAQRISQFRNLFCLHSAGHWSALQNLQRSESQMVCIAFLLPLSVLFFLLRPVYSGVHGSLLSLDPWKDSLFKEKECGPPGGFKTAAESISRSLRTGIRLYRLGIQAVSGYAAGGWGDNTLYHGGGKLYPGRNCQNDFGSICKGHVPCGEYAYLSCASGLYRLLLFSQYPVYQGQE